MKQDAPFTIQVEMTEGCNLFCKFCGVRGIREKRGDYKFLTIAKAKCIASRINATGWKSRIEFAMHGEPTANPKFLEIIKEFRKKVSNQIMITTNGFGFARDPKRLIAKAFDAGVNIIAIDDYEHNKISKKIKEQVHDGHFYPNEKDYSPHKIYPPNSSILIFISDISSSTKGTHSILNNHCGCASKPLLTPMNKRCAKPFRELSIRWDGNIAICCNDWRGHYKCGNALEMNIEKIWNNEFFMTARKILYSGARSFYPCSVCDAISYRTGLLPDKMGKQTMDPPNKEDEFIVNYALANGTYTEPVLREYEKKDCGIKGFLQ